MIKNKWCLMEIGWILHFNKCFAFIWNLISTWCNEPEVQVHVGISFTAGKDSVGTFPSPQDLGVEALMLPRSYWKRTGGQKRQRELRMKEEEMGARVTSACYSWTVYKTENSRCSLLFLIRRRAERLRSEQSFCSRHPFFSWWPGETGF